MRLLAVWTRQRLRSLPDAPTLLELGYGMVVTSPYGVAGPKGMDPQLVEALHQIFRKTQTHPRVQEYMAQNDMPDEYLGPAAYTAFARAGGVRAPDGRPPEALHRLSLPCTPVPPPRPPGPQRCPTAAA